jgi:hypothetical protein
LSGNTLPRSCPLLDLLLDVGYTLRGVDANPEKCSTGLDVGFDEKRPLHLHGEWRSMEDKDGTVQ